jgi:hypothetical protein
MHSDRPNILYLRSFLTGLNLLYEIIAHSWFGENVEWF